MQGHIPRPPPSRVRNKTKPEPVKLNPSLEGPLKFLSTSFGASYLLPPAPGTAGMIVGVGGWYVLGVLHLVPFYHFAILFVLACFAGWVTGKAEPYWGSSEASIMSTDCMVGFMMAAAPFAPAFHPNWKSMLAVIFAVFWLVEMIQPFPISKAREIPGGVGFMLDDIACALVTILITWGGFNLFWKSALDLAPVAAKVGVGDL